MTPAGITRQDIEPDDDDLLPVNDHEHPAIRAALESVNLVDHLSEDECHDIGQDCKKGFESDLQSREHWDKQIDEWTKLANQHKEIKTYPWPKASNIKFPILSTAAMQFAARAYPSLVPSDGQVVKAAVIGKDPTGEKVDQAKRVSSYMSYQIMHEMYCWEEDMDKMLIMLPIVGTMFKKTYWSKITGYNVSELVHPKNIIVNYWTKNLRDCERISEVIEMSARILKERQLAGLFCECDLGKPVVDDSRPFSRHDTKHIPEVDKTTPHHIVEQHTFLDLNKTGYALPYIVTFHKETGKVLRISARFDEKSIKKDDDGKIIRVDPVQYYTKFGFVPNPDGGFYDIGFGMLLGPINESVNTIINQLVDAGTLSNLQSGFIGKGLRIKMGETRFQPGEWKAVNSTADDLKKQIFPMPTKEPSHVLFELMGSLISSGKELASVAEIFVGKMPGQNTPATTTMATIEQGMKVFTAVYKRIYRSLAEEYQKLFRLNEVYLNPQTYQEVLGIHINPHDFTQTGYKICPGADPTAVSQTEKLLKAQGLMELLPTGMLDPMEVIQRVLEAQEQPNWQKLIHKETQQSGQPAQGQPDPKQVELQMKQQMMQQQAQTKQEELAFKSHLAEQDQATKQQMAKQAQDHDIQYKQQLLALKAAEAQHKAQSGTAEQTAQTIQSLVHNEQTHQQKMSHTEEAHKLAQSQSKSSKTGKANS